MKRFKNLLLIVFCITLCISVFAACSKEKNLDTKLSMNDLLDKYAAQEAKRSASDSKVKLTLYNKSSTANYLEEKVTINRTVVDQKALMDFNMITSNISPDMVTIIGKLLPMFFENSTDDDTEIQDWITNFTNKEGYITGALGFDEDIYNCRFDFCSPKEIPDWKLPSGLLKEGANPNAFFGLSAKDIDAYLLKFTSFFGVVNPFEMIFSDNYLKIMDFSTIVDQASGTFNKGEKAFLYNIKMTANEVKTAFTNGLTKMVDTTYAKLIEDPDTKEEAEQLKYYYEEYKDIVLKMFSFNPITLNAKSDIKGKLLSIDYNLGMTVRLDVNVIMDIVEKEITDTAKKTKIANMLYAINVFLGSKDNTKDCIDISLEMINNEYIAYEKVAFKNDDDLIFSKANENPLNRRMYAIDKDGKLVEIK